MKRIVSILLCAVLLLFGGLRSVCSGGRGR